MLLDPTFSSPLAGASVSHLESSLPADLSGISIEPIAESTHRVGDSSVTVGAAIAPNPSPTCSDSDVPLAAVARSVNPSGTFATRGGEGSPPTQKNVVESQKTVSPRFSSFLHKVQTTDDDDDRLTGSKHGELIRLSMHLSVGVFCGWGFFSLLGVGVLFAVLVRLVVPDKGGSGVQSTSGQCVSLVPGVATPVVRFSFADSGEEDAEPGSSQRVSIQRPSMDVENVSVDPFVARK